jgi:DNA-binding response OmpR family regulator
MKVINIDRVEASPLLLVVEAHFEIQEIYRVHLRNSGFRVLAARNRAEALKVLVRYGRQIALILVDESLFSTEEIRRLLKFCDKRKIPLLVVSSEYEHEEDPEDFKRLIEQWLENPVTAGHLLEILQNHHVSV